jgi:hypothetical protein
VASFESEGARVLYDEVPYIGTKATLATRPFGLPLLVCYTPIGVQERSTWLPFALRGEHERVCEHCPCGARAQKAAGLSSSEMGVFLC